MVESREKRGRRMREAISGKEKEMCSLVLNNEDSFMPKQTRAFLKGLHVISEPFPWHYITIYEKP